MSRTPVVSVVIPLYNAEKWLEETLASVFSQNAVDIEVIVVDDGSTDGSAALVSKLYRTARVVTTKNEGVSAARNLGTQLSQGEFIQYLDADDLLGPGKLKVQLKYLEESGADVAYGSWEKLTPSTNGQYSRSSVIDRRIEGSAEIELLVSFWCPPAAYLFRRKIVQRTKGWSTTLPVIQDARFAFDCAAVGGRFVYCPGLMASYRAHRVGSVSTRDPRAFVRDCFRNVTEVEGWWEEHGGITEERLSALVQCYGYVARSSFENDKLTFEEAYSALERVRPGYVPSGSTALAVATYLFGYPTAESLASIYRRTKKYVTRGSAGLS